MTGFLTALPDWHTLSLAQQVAQMVVVRASGHLFDQQIEYPDWEPPVSVLQRWVQDWGVGGVILLGGTAAEVALRTHQLQSWATTPLLIAADIEEGVGQRFAGATWFPPPMAIGAIAAHDLDCAMTYAEAMGSATAAEALAIGINWVLAPVVDVNNNPANPVINLRAWGETPALVSQLSEAFIRGAQRHPVLTTAKHFPGHGDTAIDSHLDLPVLSHDRERLEQIELPPFQRAIAAGVDAVITAHLQIPALDSIYPATLSPNLLTGLLRQDLGFDGLIVTDALIMGAITKRYGTTEASVLAVLAGADIVLMPVDPEATIEAICEAVEAGRIPVERIHQSLERIWRAKQKVSNLSIAGNTSHAWEQIPPPTFDIQGVTHSLAQPQTLQTAAAILQASQILHRPSPCCLDALPSDQPRRNLILVDDWLNSPFLTKQAPAIILPQQHGYMLQRLDRFTPPCSPETTQAPVPALLQLFLRSNPFRGIAGLSHIAQDWLQFLLHTKQLQAFILYGNPYSLEQFVAQLPAEIPYVFSYGQMPAAQSLALNALLKSTQTSTQLTTQHNREFTD